MTLSKLRTISHKTLTAFMSVWLSGILFLFCCQELSAKAAEAEFCPLPKVTPHCDKGGRFDIELSFAESTGRHTMGCCGFLPAVFDKTRKIEQAQKQVAVTPKPVPLKFAVPHPPKKSTPAVAFYSRLPDKQSTFIQNCVFRI